MNINEQLLDLLLKRDLLLQRVSNGLSKEVALYYTELINQAINTIKDYDEITIVKMNKLIKEINSRIEFNYEEQLANKFQELGVVEATYIPTAINGLIGVNIVDRLLPEPLIQRIINNSYLADGLTIAESFEKLNDNLKNTFQSQIRLSVLNGDTNQQIIKTLKPILNEFTTNKIDSLVKTAVSTVANNTRMEVYKENEDIFKGYEHQSVLDNRTTLQCATRDGSYWDLEHKGLNDKGKQFKFLVPPLHFRCRSLLLPILKSFRDLGLDLDEVTGLTRSSIDGELPRETNFDKWFSSKDKAFQESYLGKGRYELYKDGKISLSDLVNQKGKTLTIDELKKFNSIKESKQEFKKDSLTSDEKYLINKKWCGSEYGKIRKSYYDNDNNPDKKELEDLFKKYDGNYDGEVYRGMAFFKKNEERVKMFEQFANIEIGDTFTDNAPMSFSKNPEVAKKFGELADNNIHSVIIILRNYKTKAYDISNISWNEWEEEVLVKDKIEYKVVEKKVSKSGNILLTLEE